MDAHQSLNEGFKKKMILGKNSKNVENQKIQNKLLYVIVIFVRTGLLWLIFSKILFYDVSLQGIRLQQVLAKDILL